MCSSCLSTSRPAHQFKIGQTVRVYDEVESGWWDEIAEITGLLWSPPGHTEGEWVYQITYNILSDRVRLPTPHTELAPGDVLFPVCSEG